MRPPEPSPPEPSPLQPGPLDAEPFDVFAELRREWERAERELADRMVREAQAGDPDALAFIVFMAGGYRLNTLPLQPPER